MSKFSIKINAVTQNLLAESTANFYIPLYGYNGACHGLFSIGVGNLPLTGPTLALKMNRTGKLFIKFKGSFDVRLQCGFPGCVQSADITASPKLVISSRIFDFNSSIYTQSLCNNVCQPKSSSASGSGFVTTNILGEGQIIYIYINYDIINRGGLSNLQINNNSYIFIIEEIL